MRFASPGESRDGASNFRLKTHNRLPTRADQRPKPAVTQETLHGPA